MTTPNLDAETRQPPDEEPEGIRRMKEDYSPEKVEEILESIRRAADNPDKGEWMALEDYLKVSGVTADEALEAYLEKRGLTKDDIK